MHFIIFPILLVQRKEMLSKGKDKCVLLENEH